MTFTTLPSAGQVLTAATLSALITELRPLWVRKLSDESISSNAVLQDDDELVLPVAANTVYEMDCFVRYSSGTTPDIKFAWTFPAGALMRYSGIVYPVAGATTIFQFVQTDTIGCEGSTSGPGVARFAGTVITSATSGSLRLQWAQNTSTASATIVQQHSYLKLRKAE